MAAFLFDRGFWTDPDFEQAAPLTCHLYLYLSGNQHVNLIGLYAISQHRIGNETRMTKNQIRIATTELLEMEKVETDPDLDLFWVKALLKRERNFTQDTFFKGVKKTIVQLPEREITRNFLAKYEADLRRQPTGKRYTEADKIQLMAFLDRFHGPSMAHGGPIEGPSMAPRDRNRDRNSIENSEFQEEEERIAKDGPENPEPLNSPAEPINPFAPPPRPETTQADLDRAKEVLRLYPSKAKKDSRLVGKTMAAQNILAARIASSRAYPWEEHAELENQNDTPKNADKWAETMPDPVALEALRAAKKAATPTRNYL